jgi:hypothetical protein
VSAGAARAESEIEAALDAHGFEPRRLVPISLFQGDNKGGRYAFLVECDDGRRVKARHLGDEEEARRLCELREGLEPAFAPVLGRRGAVLLETWVDGVDAGAEEAERRSAEAGGLLGRLHAMPLAGGAGRPQDTAPAGRGAERDSELLVGGGALSEAEAGSLLAELAASDPRSFSPALIHRDFCRENFVVDERGGLVVVDNEWFEIGAPGLDLGRTFHRWPMSRAAWERFLDAYEAAHEPVPALRFWMIAAALWGARVYLQVMPARLPPLQALLRSLGAGERPHDRAQAARR